jgi:hypothetical protein
MRPVSHAPRQPYRLYSEAEFLAAEDWPEPVEAEPAFAAIGEYGPRPWGRAVALAALCAVAVAVTGVVAMHEARSRAGSGRRSASRRLLPRPPREGRPTSSLPTERGASGGDRRRRSPAGRAPVTVRPVAERHGQLSPPPAAHTFTRSRPALARAAISAPATTGTTVTAPVEITAPAMAPPVETVAVASDTATVSGARAEFGFER